MSTSKLMKVTYYDPKSQIRLLCYADTVVWDTKPTPTLTALRFGGYPERVQGLADAIYGGATIEIEDGKDTYSLKTLTRQYRRELSHDGVYAEATLIAEDDGQSAKQNAGDKDEPDKDKNDEDDDQIQQDLPPRNTYIFCTPGERRELFDAVDQKTAVPMIPEYQDYVLTELQKRNILRPLQVKSLSRKLEAWLLRCEEKDKNIVAVMEDGLKSGAISIPGATVGLNPLDEINSITEYLNTFGVTVAERIKKLFVPLFDPATESLSPEVLAINQYIEDHAGYPLYDAQLAVAEAIKRQLERSKVGLIVAECGSGKSKIGAVSIAATAAGLLSHQMSVKVSKTFNLILCPSHVTEKWVRELEETVPNAFAAVVHTPAELDHLYQMFERGNKFCFAVLSKEKARDGYMRAPAVIYRPWNREALPIERNPPLHDGADIDGNPHKPVFCCPECGAVVMAEFTQDGVSYRVPAKSYYFRREHSGNHKCAACGAPLWSALNPDAWRRQKKWAKIGDYGFVYRPLVYEHFKKAGGEGQLQKLYEIQDHPDACFPARGAYRAYALSSYIKRKYKGKIYGLIVDELHEYSNKSGQGEAMAELYGTAKKVVGMTATLINGYSSGIFHLLYRICPAQMRKDNKRYENPSKFDAEYGVIQNTYVEQEPEYNSNRRTVQSKKNSRLLPGVSPLVYSRFLLDKAAFLSLTDMGKDLPEYPAIKAACEGRQLPAYEAASEFISQVAGNLDELLEKASGKKGALNTLERLEQKRDRSMEELQKLMKQIAQAGPEQLPELEKQAVKAANQAQSQVNQTEAVGHMVRDQMLQNKEAVSGCFAQAVRAAAQKAESVSSALLAWGYGPDSNDPERRAADLELAARVGKSPTLMEVARYLGRLKELMDGKRKNGYAYGRGEKYSLELGGDINRAIASEFAMLAAPETLPLFLRKLQRKALKQYQRREPICKGSGDIICMLDESSSAESQAPWCKAVALALLDIAMRDQRRFAVIHFAGVGDVQTDLFLPGQYDREDVLRCAETFLNGNTDYETPLREALRLMEQEGFENADMVFVTDGECVLPDSFLEKLKAEQSARGFQITGILLDQEDAGFEFSLRESCTNVYRTSQLSRDQIAEQLVVSRVA